MIQKLTKGELADGLLRLLQEAQFRVEIRQDESGKDYVYADLCGGCCIPATEHHLKTYPRSDDRIESDLQGADALRHLREFVSGEGQSMMHSPVDPSPDRMTIAEWRSDSTLTAWWRGLLMSGQGRLLMKVLSDVNPANTIREEISPKRAIGRIETFQQIWTLLTQVLTTYHEGRAPRQGSTRARSAPPHQAKL